MRFYDIFMAPLESLYLKKIRKEIMPKAYGKVLEIGFGNGANMKYYNHNQIKELHALDIKETMRQYKDVKYHVFDAKKLPFEDESFDTVVLTLALCSIENVKSALREIQRILKEDGLYLFVEHEAPSNKHFKKLFNTLNPLWKKMTKGCQINLKTHTQIKKAGFKLNHQHKHIFHYGLAQKI
ncbi:MAG TPA: class I SAM-dependent methyltransferase [Erysipelothrix sp.]|nr:class I SAM-dependent methyltransferase [Erysipelothrix sp.]